jgi:hypothetical protein
VKGAAVRCEFCREPPDFPRVQIAPWQVASYKFFTENVMGYDVTFPAAIYDHLLDRVEEVLRGER